MLGLLFRSTFLVACFFGSIFAAFDNLPTQLKNAVTNVDEFTLVEQNTIDQASDQDRVTALIQGDLLYRKFIGIITRYQFNESAIILFDPNGSLVYPCYLVDEGLVDGTNNVMMPSDHLYDCNLIIFKYFIGLSSSATLTSPQLTMYSDLENAINSNSGYIATNKLFRVIHPISTLPPCPCN